MGTSLARRRRLRDNRGDTPSPCADARKLRLRGGILSPSLDACAWPDLEAGDHSLLAVPVGATEQHGPHLPCTTDTDLALALVAGLAARRSVVVGPALAYGSSGEHQGFAGTVSIGAAATELLLLELCRSASAWCSRMLLVSTHGGNSDPVRRATAVLRREGRDVRVFSPAWGIDAHAGRAETSLMLAVAGDRVRMDRARPGNTEALSVLLPALRADGVRAVSANGVLGDPTAATAAEGRLLLGAAVDDLCRFVAEWSPAPRR